MLGRLLRPLLALAFIALAVWQVRALVVVLAPAPVRSDMDTSAVMQGPFEVGFTREGVLTSASELTIKLPERLTWGDNRLTYVIADGTKVKQGQLLAKVDVGQFRFEVDNQKMEYQNAVRAVGQAKRNSQREVEQAEQEVDRTIRSVAMQGQSTSVETEQAKAQVGFDTWDLARTQKDYERQQRLRGFGLVPGTQVEQAERSVRAKEFSLAAAQKNLTQREAENQIRQSQSATDIDTARFNLELAKRRVKDTERDSSQRVKHSKEWLDRLQQDLANGEVRAPGDGMVVLNMAYDDTGRHILRVGDRLWNGIGCITDPRKLEVAVRVNEALASKVKVGQEVMITAEGTQGRRFEGRVASIGMVARTVSPWEDITAVANERVFDVLVRVLDVDPRLLRPGMKAKAKFVFRRLAKARYVPVTSVLHRPGEGEYVYVAQGDRFVARKVKTGARNDEAVEIRGGLKPGERVALSDPTKVETE